MHDKATSASQKPLVEVDGALARPRADRRAKTLQVALSKRAAGVPTYTVPEAAALLSVSQEHLYRQIKSDAFPAVDMRRRLGRGKDDRGKYVVPARAVEALLDAAIEAGALVEAASYCPTGGAV